MVVVKLAVSHALADQATARRIGSLCGELGIDCFLDERGDWLAQGLHPRPEDCTHLLVVLSAATEGTWWVPFQVGRAVEREMPVMVYREDPGRSMPAFVQGQPSARGMEQLGAMLRSWPES